MTQRAITMATITEDYVNFEIAKLLKENGFNEPCFNYYECHKNDINGKGAAFMFSTDLAQKNFNHITYHLINKYNDNDNELILCPTLQMAMKWLREVHNLNIEVFYFNPDKDNLWAFEVIKLPLGGTLYGEYDKEKYEEAVEVALKYCLENLI